MNGHFSIFTLITFYTFASLRLWVCNPKPAYQLQNSSGYDTACLCVYVCVCMDDIKVWVSCKMQSRFQQKMCLAYHAQNCLMLRTGKTGNLNLLFYYHDCFLWILSQNRHGYFKKKCSSNLAVVYPEGFQGRYTGLGTQLCIQLMKYS